MICVKVCQVDCIDRFYGRGVLNQEIRHSKATVDQYGGLFLNQYRSGAESWFRSFSTADKGSVQGIKRQLTIEPTLRQE